MKLFLLTTTSNQMIWDAYDKKLIRAENEKEARHIANEYVGDEGKIWEDPQQVSSEIITSDGSAGEIITSFCNG